MVECKELAADFTFRRKAGFDNCVGCIDGMLLWMEKPFLKECEKVGVDSGKIYCSQKGKFGLNLQECVMPIDSLPIYLYNILHWHQTT